MDFAVNSVSCQISCRSLFVVRRLDNVQDQPIPYRRTKKKALDSESEEGCYWTGGIRIGIASHIPAGFIEHVRQKTIHEILIHKPFSLKEKLREN